MRMLCAWHWMASCLNLICLEMNKFISQKFACTVKSLKSCIAWRKIGMFLLKTRTKMLREVNLLFVGNLEWIPSSQFAGWKPNERIAHGNAMGMWHGESCALQGQKHIPARRKQLTSNAFVLSGRLPCTPYTPGAPLRYAPGYALIRLSARRQLWRNSLQFSDEQWIFDEIHIMSLMNNTNHPCPFWKRRGRWVRE